MKIRLLGDDVPGLAYNGIRDPDKLRDFLMTDLLSYHVHRRVSNRFHSKGGDEAKRERHREMSIAVSRALALDFHGDNVGTPADQISKRVANMVDRMDGLEQGNGSPSTLVTDAQFAVCSDFHTGGPSQISVRLMPPLNRGLSLPPQDGGPRTRVGMRELCDGIVDGILVPSRDSLALQCVLWNQYDLARRTLERIKGLDEETMLDCIRMYLALRCILKSGFQSVGDVFEPVLEESSFLELLPPLPGKVEVEDPVVIGICDESIAPALTSTSGPFPGAPCLRCSAEREDIGVQLYKSRLMKDYGQCPLVLVLGPSAPEAAVSVVSSELDGMGWRPSPVVVLKEGAVGDRLPGCVHVDTSGKSAYDLCRDLGILKETGVLPDDGRILSLVKGPYMDVLASGFSSMEPLREEIARARDIRVIARMCRDRTGSAPSEMCPSRELAAAVRDAVLSLDSGRRSSGDCNGRGFTDQI